MTSIDRKTWINLLSRAPVELLETQLDASLLNEVDWLRKPETGLMMVQGRAGGTGERFNLGELTVTRCTIKLPANAGKANVGVAYVLGRSHKHAQLAALADALLQDQSNYNDLIETLLKPIQQNIAARADRRRARTEATKVEFFTVAREANGMANDEESE